MASGEKIAYTTSFDNARGKRKARLRIDRRYLSEHTGKNPEIETSSAQEPAGKREDVKEAAKNLGYTVFFENARKRRSDRHLLNLNEPPLIQSDRHLLNLNESPLIQSDRHLPRVTPSPSQSLHQNTNKGATIPKWADWDYQNCEIQGEKGGCCSWFSFKSREQYNAVKN